MFFIAMVFVTPSWATDKGAIAVVPDIEFNVSKETYSVFIINKRVTAENEATNFLN